MTNFYTQNQQPLKCRITKHCDYKPVDEDGLLWINTPLVNTNHSKYAKKLNKNVKTAYERFVADHDRGKWNKPKKHHKDFVQPTEWQSPQALDMMFTLSLTAYNTWKHLSFNNIVTNAYLVARIYNPDAIYSTAELIGSGIFKQYEKFIDIAHKTFEKYYFDKGTPSKRAKKEFFDWVSRGEKLISMPRYPGNTSHYAADHYNSWCVAYKHDGDKVYGNAILNDENLNTIDYLVLNAFVYFTSGGRIGEPNLAIAGMKVKDFNVFAINKASLEGTIEMYVNSKILTYTIPEAIISAYAELGGWEEDISSATDSAEELSEEDKLVVYRARKVQRFLSQPFHVAEQFTGIPGVLVDIKDTIKGFNMIMDGELDHLPEAAFNLKGSIQCYRDWETDRKSVV